jgi:hypothetical protein
LSTVYFLLGLQGTAYAVLINSTWNGGVGNWNVAGNWSPAGVPNNGGGNTFNVLIDNGNATASTVSLDTSVTIENLTIDSGDTLNQKSGRSLTQSGITNNGSYNMNSVGTTTDLRMTGGSNVTLQGNGTLNMSNNINNRILDTGGEDLIHGAGHTIQGSGQILAAMTNNGTVNANASAGITLSTNTKTNNGLMKASGGGDLRVNVDVDGTGNWEADGAGSMIQLNSGTDVTTTGTITIKNGAELELNNATITGSNLSMDATSIIDISSTVSLSRGLTFAMTDETKWVWDASAVLKMTGGVGAGIGNWGNWGFLEVGGRDLGTDPANHVGAAGGFSNNFDLTELTIGAGASVFLQDLFDNGNRSSAEALYVSTLRFSDSLGLLNLNGLHLYYSTFIGNPNQIIDMPVSFAPVPEPCTMALLSMGLGLVHLRRMRR